ncbi:hypothetical protein ANCDUO_05638 [Ancylostoma duodenale]|uniref:Uncharacterized protein n=1 Tax=Ancylostoma duodenale TaxID=51022 RepID=A0A0C2GRY0_9BILA|nr:hypothetical protein ANCDUO_05638 [Ancylostoma duodenale]
MPIATTLSNLLHSSKITEIVVQEGPHTYSKKSAASKHVTQLHTTTSTDSWSVPEVTPRTNSNHTTVISKESADSTATTGNDLSSTAPEPTSQGGASTVSRTAPVIPTLTNTHYVNESTDLADQGNAQKEDSNSPTATESSTIVSSPSMDLNYPNAITPASAEDSTKTTTSELSTNIAGTSVSTIETTLTAYAVSSTAKPVLPTEGRDVMHESNYSLSTAKMSSMVARSRTGPSYSNKITKTTAEDFTTTTTSEFSTNTAGTSVSISKPTMTAYAGSGTTEPLLPTVRTDVMHKSTYSLSPPTVSSTVAKGQMGPSYSNEITPTSTEDSTRTTTLELATNIAGTNVSISEPTMTAYAVPGTPYPLFPTVGTDVIHKLTYSLSTATVPSTIVRSRTSPGYPNKSTPTGTDDTTKISALQLSTDIARTSVSINDPTKTAYGVSGTANSLISRVSTDVTREYASLTRQSTRWIRKEQKLTTKLQETEMTSKPTYKAHPGQQTIAKEVLETPTEKVATVTATGQLAQNSSVAHVQKESSRKATDDILNLVGTTPLSSTWERNYADVFEQQTTTETTQETASSLPVTIIETSQQPVQKPSTGLGESEHHKELLENS